MKKDFSQIQTGRVKAAVEQATGRAGQQATASKEEAAERRQEMKTQGRKGAKLHRINMAFSDPNYEFLKVMARATGRTMTEFCNDVVTAYRNEHPELLQEAEHFLEVVNSGLFYSREN